MFSSKKELLYFNNGKICKRQKVVEVIKIALPCIKEDIVGSSRQLSKHFDKSVSGKKQHFCSMHRLSPCCVILNNVIYYFIYYQRCVLSFTSSSVDPPGLSCTSYPSSSSSSYSPRWTNSFLVRRYRSHSLQAALYSGLSDCTSTSKAFIIQADSQLGQRIQRMCFLDTLRSHSGVSLTL